MTGWGCDYWTNQGISASTYGAPSIPRGPTPSPMLAGTNPKMAWVTDGLSNTTMLLEHAGYDVHYVTGVGTPMNMATDLTLDQPVRWAPGSGGYAFTVQGYANYTPATYPTTLSNIPAGTDLRHQLQQLSGRVWL